MSFHLDVDEFVAGLPEPVLLTSPLHVASVVFPHV